MNLSQIFSSLALLVCVLDLLGWLLGIPGLRSVFAGLPQMIMPTASTLALLSLAILSISWQRRGPSAGTTRLARFFALAGMSLPILTLFNVHVFSDHISTPVCVTTLSLGASVLIYSLGGSSRNRYRFDLFALVPLPVSILSAVVYFYGLIPGRGISRLTGHSLPSAFAVFLLAIALLAREGSRSPVSIFFRSDSAGKISRKLALVAFLLPFPIGILIHQGVLIGLYPASFSYALFISFLLGSLLFLALQTGRWVRDSERRALQSDRDRRAGRETKRRLEAVDKIKNRMLRAFVSSNIGYWERDLVTGEVTWSEIQSRVFGFAGHVESTSMENIFKLVHPEDFLPTESAVINAVETKTDFEVEFRVIVDGQVRWIVGRGRAEYAVDGTPLRLTGTNFDVTDRKIITERVAEQAQNLKNAEAALIAAKEEAESANNHKTVFLANMSHEIRTPLTAILGFVELLKHGELAESQRRDYFAIIRRNGEQLLGLINDVLDFSKVESGKLEINTTGCQVIRLVHDTVASLMTLANQKGLQLFCEVHPRVPQVIGTDSVRLRQILLNLVSNAIKFSDQGAVHVVVSAQSDGVIAFTVEDHGIGISPNHASALFRPFVQADVSITREFGGTGLGLSLSRVLARALGGDVILKKSQVGVGSVFEATIENRPWFEERVELPGEPVAHEPSSSIAGYRVLLVEDSEDNQELISEVLTQMGATVDIADNGLVGLELVSILSYDIILLDLQMPVMDGYTMVRRLRESKHEGPVIALTAHATSENRGDCLSAGFDDYITKPIDWKMLATAIHRHVARPASPGAEIETSI